MNEHSLRVLEYDDFLEFLSRYACSDPGRDRLRGLRPAPRESDVAVERRLYADLLRLRREGFPLPPARFESPAEALQRAAPERAVLDPEGFLLVRGLLAAVAELRARLTPKACGDAQGLLELAGALDGRPELMRAIARTFDDEQGHVRDDASARLQELRARIGAVERNIHGRLDAILHDPTRPELFQEDFITTRHGRYVLPVRRELRAQLRGIVHDQSNSGNTLFIEPEEIVEQGNELECLRLDERDEIRRVLGALTAALRTGIERVRSDHELLCWYDAAYAVSAWAQDYDCVCPEIGTELRLRGARHPLLQRRLAEEGRLAELVPLDLDLPAGCNVVVITGSNTGGKTVALKTIGLLTLLAQTGLPIPAEQGTRVRCFANVLADIGDEQSIEQSLSTFSAHLEQIVGMLGAARDSVALVLLDELGAGTDPIEGGALSCALLDALSRAGGLTFATTHLGVVKRFVHEHPKMENASVLFDVETLQPQYRLLMGRAGASYALAIAERRGIPAEVIEAARGLMTAGDVQLESMLSALDQKELRLARELRALEKAREEALQARDLAKQDRDRINTELKSLRRERRRLLHQAQDEAASLVAHTRREVERVLAAARKGPDRRQARDLREQMERQGQSLAEALRQTRARPEQPLGAGPLKTGERVWIESVKDHGVVAAVSAEGTRVKVKVGNLHFEVGREDLGRARDGGAGGGASAGPAVRVGSCEAIETRRSATRGPSQPPANSFGFHRAGRDGVSPCPISSQILRAGGAEAARELNLVGEHVTEALAKLERFLDAALLAGLQEVRIVHGFGTGALRNAVQAYLREADVKGFRLGEDGRDPGGAGCTLVEL